MSGTRRAAMLEEARAARARGDLDLAVRRCEAVLAEAPDDLEAVYLLGAIQAQRGADEAALRCFERVLEREPCRAEAWNARGVLLERHGALAEAEHCYARAIGCAPRAPTPRYNLGRMLLGQGRAREARALLEEAARLDPRGLPPLLMLASACHRLGDLEGMRASLERAHRLAPADPTVLRRLGDCARHRGEAEEAVRWYGQALAVAPDDAVTRWNRALMLLALGRWREAWPDYELGLELGERRVAPLPGVPRWDGSPAGRLLVQWEQGYGDTIQFARLLPEARRRVAHLTFHCQPELAALLARSLPGCTVVSGRVPPPGPWDAAVPLLSLPGVLGLAPDLIPGGVPYLRPDPERVASWRARLAAREGATRHVGIVWSGNPAFRANGDRSSGLAAFGALAGVEGVRFHALQKGPAEAELASPPPGLAVTPLGPSLRGFDDTAAAICALDLVVTVDTAVAHLAGALGRPVWILLCHSPDWRWGTAGERTAWYPTARLFRQPRRGDWAAVFREVRASLEGWRQETEAA